METQVLSIEQMKEVIELDIDISNASCIWCKVRAITPDKKGYTWALLPEHINKFDEEHIPTFTLQDILEAIKERVLEKDLSLDLQLDLLNSSLQLTKEIDYRLHTANGNNILEAAFNMLKWCKQNNYI